MRSGTVDDPGPAGDGLTPVRREILRVIKESTQGRGYSPSLREIGDAVGLASTSSVSHQLSVLQAKGYLVREPGRPRTMILRFPGQSDVSTEPKNGPEGVTEVPLVGRIAAGVPILADELVEGVVPLPRMLVGSGDDLIMLKVVGDSMIGAAIADGDWLVVRRQATAGNGEVPPAKSRASSTRASSRLSNPWCRPVLTMYWSPGLCPWLRPQENVLTGPGPDIGTCASCRTVRERTSLSPRFPCSFAAFQDTTHLSCQPAPRSSPATPSSTLTGTTKSVHETPSDHNAPFDRQ